MAVKSQYDTNLIYRKLDDDGDYVLGNGRTHLSGLDAMTQVIKTRLRVVRGEWWQGDATALPYFDTILGSKSMRKEALDLMVVARIMDTVGVISVYDINSSLKDRKYSFSCKVKTVYGDTAAEVSA